MSGTALPKMALITPYDGLANGVRSLASETFQVHIFKGYLESACDIAKNFDAEDYDVILSRGGTAEYIRAVTDIPVVRVLTYATDLLHALLPYKATVRRVAFFNYMRSLASIDDVAAALDMSIDEYTFLDAQDISSRIKTFRPGNYDVIVGGSPTIAIASELGFKGVLIGNGAASIEAALREAKAIVEEKYRMRSDLARLKSILSSIAEGIIVTNEADEIIIFNAAAQKIFNLTEGEVIGRQVHQVIKNSRIEQVRRSQSPEFTELQDIGMTTIITSRAPVSLGDTCIGVVCSFTDAPQIQKAERIIRKRLQGKGFVSKYTFDDICTVNSHMLHMINLAKIYAKTDSTVLLHGESGTGKELFAQSLHAASARADGPFVAINCDAVPATLLESELFGYEGGSFTGARREGRAGLIEISHNGTLFLDEIGDFPLSLQSKLLRVLQEREIMRVGGKEIIPVDVRIIGATNKDLPRMTADGSFRKDLFYRLNVLSLTIPSLRERREDIPFLVKRFLDDGFDQEKYDGLLHELQNYAWPGNVRELRAMTERLFLISKSFPDMNWPELLRLTGFVFSSRQDGLAVRDKALSIPLRGDLKQIIQNAEILIIQRYLETCGNKREEVMRALNISKMSLWRKLSRTARNTSEKD